MTPVFGHGRLRLYLLKLLDESPRHGYEIIQQLKERFAGLYAPSAGTVYPRLARLESEGLVRHETDGGRKIYHITDAGRAELAAKTAELDDLENEIRNSVRDLAEGIREEVRESARTVQEELASAAREAQRSARGAQPSGGPSAPFPFPFGPGPLGPWPTGARPPQPPLPPDGPDGPEPADAPPGEGAPGSPVAAAPPPESVHWTKEQWREWKQQQREQWRDWQRDWQRSQREQRGQWKDAQRAWKDQWARQWKEQWEEQQRLWSTAPPPWAWWTGSGAGPGDTDSPADQAGEQADGQTGSQTGGQTGEPEDERPQDGRGRQRTDWERFGPQLRDLIGYLRREGGPMLDAARRHGPLDQEEMQRAHAIIDHALAELRTLFEPPAE
jgi:DNA-binding PadR family transcriptional regulator